MISPDRVAAVIPTRGDCDMSQIITSLRIAGVSEVHIWDNSREKDEGIFGRYAAIGRTTKPVIVTQDDDLLVTCWPEILKAYEPGVLTVNYPEPLDIPWVARGAVFDRDLPAQAFARYLAEYPYDRLFTHRICDAVFGELADSLKIIDKGSTDLPHGFHAGRVSTSGDWYDRDRPEAQRRCLKIRNNIGLWRDYEKVDGVARVTICERVEA